MSRLLRSHQMMQSTWVDAFDTASEFQIGPHIMRTTELPRFEGYWGLLPTLGS
jgi:hypothetical protein